MKKTNFAPFKIKCLRCKNKMRYSGVDLKEYGYSYTCDKCNFTIDIKKKKD